MMKLLISITGLIFFCVALQTLIITEAAPIAKVTRLVQTSTSSSSTNFLFRGSAPVKRSTPTSPPVFDYEGTLDLFKNITDSESSKNGGIRFPPFDATYFIDIDLMSDVYSDDPPFIDAEKSWYSNPENLGKGEFQLLPLVGNVIDPEQVQPQFLLPLLNNWTTLSPDGKLLVEWIPKVAAMMENHTIPGEISTRINKVILVHCYHGSDRTGEFMSSYMMYTRGWSLKQTLEWDVSIVGRLPNYVRRVSMKWYCLYLNIHLGKKIDCSL